jgi:hypothetical protein
MMTFLIQTKALIWKNFILFKRKTRAIIFITLTPFFVGFFLTLVADIGHEFESVGTVDGNIQPVKNITRCKQKENYRDGTDDPCISVGYGIIGDSLNIYD